ncbi:PAS domain S-box protein [bacterium]|nr:PAS domain S-box protein [bacterium]
MNRHIEKIHQGKELTSDCYRNIVEQASEAIVIVQDDRIVFHNRKAVDISGFSSEELRALPFHHFIYPEDRPMILERYQREKCGQFEEDVCIFRIQKKDGEICWLEKKATQIQCQGGRAILNLLDDITEKRKLEFEIQKALLDRTRALQRIHESVQNNLYTLSKAVNLQKDTGQSGAIQQFLRHTQNRILSLAKIHGYLSRSEHFLSVRLGDYLYDLTQDILRSSLKGVHDIRMDIQDTDAVLNIDQAISCGIVVNELVSNAVQHAFPARWNRQKSIGLKIEKKGTDDVILQVSDNGIGLPFEDIRRVESFGLQLVVLIVEDELKGEIQYSPESGSRFMIQFKGASV